MSRIVLTGAGFSKDFGGLLANEIRDELLNQSQIAGDVRLYSLLTGGQKDNKDGNYEKALSRLETKAGREPERKLYLDGLLNVFLEMDLCIRSRVGFVKSKYSSTLANVFQFVDQWLLADGESNSGHFLFTLNQDLLVERFWRMPARLSVEYFGVKPVSEPRSTMQEFFHQKITVPPSELDMTVGTTLFHNTQADRLYVKLHGSMNWLRLDGSRLMISGADKQSKIGSDTILNALWKCFEDQCLQGKVKILCLGYGFGDHHVNEVIAKALALHNAELVIVSPSSWESRKQMTDKAFRQNLSKTPASLSDIRARIRHYDGSILQHFSAGNSHLGHFGRLAKELNPC